MELTRVHRHGGDTVSHYLQEELHALFETVDPAEVPQLVEDLKSVGMLAVCFVHTQMPCNDCNLRRWLLQTL